MEHWIYVGKDIWWVARWFIPLLFLAWTLKVERNKQARNGEIESELSSVGYTLVFIFLYVLYGIAIGAFT